MSQQMVTRATGGDTVDLCWAATSSYGVCDNPQVAPCCGLCPRHHDEIVGDVPRTVGTLAT